ncbi:hypothetical protein TorRG33x02_343740 [Trema orientale]|uniref:Uncharacterized protein n=1 Tax=Trema orientale TaxID=63057 RepID=A0A2P5AR51_TREOI|nr:hypothetical protein TorRG33x02_343740 [Trema orientale]
MGTTNVDSMSNVEQRRIWKWASHRSIRERESGDFLQERRKGNRERESERERQNRGSGVIEAESDVEQTRI